VVQVGDFYYLYYAVSTFGSQISATGVAQSTTMEFGSWTDLGSTGIASVKGSPYNAIDPGIFLSGGSYYATFGSFWGDIFQVEMTNPPIKTSGAMVQVAFNASGANAIEGSFTYYNAPYHYLFFSSGICCGEFAKRLGWCVSHGVCRV
jgi:arabinan endo-1,5-alpha-L-arabinosidase